MQVSQLSQSKAEAAMPTGLPAQQTSEEANPSAPDCLPIGATRASRTLGSPRRRQEQPGGGGGQPSYSTSPIDETFRAEKRHPAPDCLYPVMSSTTSTPQSPEHSYDDETTATPHQPHPEKYASVACTYLGTRNAYQADQRPDNGETMALQCD